MTKIICALITLSFAGFTFAQSATPWDGIYSAEQASLGATEFQTQCASCHGEDLRGDNTSPSLIGMSFMFLWEDRSVAELFTKIETQMPVGRPNSLSTQTYLNIVAYILSKNNFPAGEENLNGELENLEKILIAAKPN